MARNGVFTKLLALLGTVLVWVPVLAPLVFTRWAAIGSGHFNFDWLIPAELSPVAFIGGALLLCAALLAKSRRGLIGWGLGVAIGSVGLGALLTMSTGLASGATEPQGWLWLAIVGPIVLLIGAMIELGIAGILLSMDLFTHGEPAEPTIPSAA
jgi:hypothetical protein